MTREQQAIVTLYRRYGFGGSPLGCGLVAVTVPWLVAEPKTGSCTWCVRTLCEAYALLERAGILKRVDRGAR